MRRLTVTVSGLLIVGLLFAVSPALAQTTMAGSVTSTAPGTFEPGAPTISHDAGTQTTTIVLNSARTILNFDGFNLPNTGTLNLQFADRSHIALLRVASGAGEVNGQLNTTVSGSPGGNVWFSAPAGLTFGPSSDVDVGGMHATTGDITNTGFVNNVLNFAEADGDVTIQGSGLAGAQIRSHGGPLAFIGRAVSQTAGSYVGYDSNAGLGTQAETEVAFGAMREYSLGISQDLTTGGDYDLLSLTPSPAGAATGGTAPGTIDLKGSTGAGDIFVGSQGTGAVTLGGFVNATRAATIGGDITINTGGGMTRAHQEVRATAPRATGAAAQPLNINGPTNALGQLLARATGNLTLGGTTSGPRGSGETVAFSTDGVFANNRAADPQVVVSPRWVVYAASPIGLVPGSLDSATQALWNRDIDDVSPGADALGTKRYVFQHQPTLTFTSLGVTKTWNDDAAATIDAAYTKSGLHPGVTGAFAADTEGTAFTGQPELSSIAELAGRELVNDTAAVDDGPYPITITQNTLASPSGYAFAFQSTGLLDVDPVPGDDPPVINPLVTGTLGANGWHTSNVTVDWDVTDPESDTLDETDCGPTTVTSDTAGASFTCTAIARGRRVRQTATVKRDATPPAATATATSGGARYAEGATAPGDVQIRFTCTDATSGAASPPATTITAEGDTPLVPGTCTDNAGNSARTWFGPIRISRPQAPVVVPGTTTTPSPSGGGLPPTTATRALVAAQVRSALSTLRKLGLARFASRGYTRQFTADQAGVAIEEILGASRGARQSAAKAVVLARGTSRFTAAGKKKITVKLTKAGKRAMRRERSMKLTARVTFRPASGAKALAASKALTLKTKR